MKLIVIILLMAALFFMLIATLPLIVKWFIACFVCGAMAATIGV